MAKEIVNLVLKFARENPTWGYDRIQGALANIGHEISDQTVGNILKDNGIEPAPDRQRTTTWGSFLKAHWDSLAAIDFTSTEVWTMHGLVTMFVLVVIELKTRRIEIAGVTANPDSALVRQMSRNLTDDKEGFCGTRLTSWWTATPSSYRSESFWKPVPRLNQSCCRREAPIATRTWRGSC